MSTPSDKIRFAPGYAAKDGTYVYNWRLTSSSIMDAVHLTLPPDHVLPVIFVPGIMGSNLRQNSGKKRESVWRLDNSLSWLKKNTPLSFALGMAKKSAGARQKLMHPSRVEVDPSGHVPDSPHDAAYYTAKGWGEVGEGSYKEFLLWLDHALNAQGYNPARWKEFFYTQVRATPRPGEIPPEPKLSPGLAMQMQGLPPLGEKGAVPLLSDDLIARARFRMPVYAFGYNWLDSNFEAAKRLRQRITDVIRENNVHSKCTQVILVTHSMGGLVARACQKLGGMQDAIAGIAHGVMPSIGAAVAYRRCKIGMRDEDWTAGMVIGNTGRDVTAVFAQAPGALQLLPTAQYRPGWLTIAGPSGQSIESQPASGDPYKDIYLRRDRWWGLIREEWLHPYGGMPITWETYKRNIDLTRFFHEGIKNAYHATTYVFYGKDPAQKSFEGVHWQIKPGLRPDNKTPPTLGQVADMGFGDVRDDGSNPLHVGGKQEVAPAYGYGFSSATVYETSYWDLQCAKQDGGGDGTVPISSGAFPSNSGGGAIQQQFGLTGFAHEGAYRDNGARTVTLYAIQKIAARAQVTA
ncbi:hypothetical protein ACVWWQ_002705 [Rhodanobacter sp. TND4EL1]